MAKEKVVLAYSGGLDTSCILKWLADKGYEVIAYVADIGQKDDFEKVKAKALATGASKCHVLDLKKEFVTDYIFSAIRANAIYEGRYLLGTSLARPLIAKHQIEVAHKEGAQYVAHGATGKGNDQCRFELSYLSLDPKIKIISPWKTAEFMEQFKGRDDLIAYAKKNGIPVDATLKKPYSEDENLMHISHEAGILEAPEKIPADSVYSRTVSPKDAPNESTFLEIFFKDGTPVKVVNKNTKETKEEPLELFTYLNKVGAENGVGRMDMVENRFVGIKSRGLYETPGGTILYTAHKDIESIAMDREVMRLRDTLSPRMAEIIYYGFWFSPEMDFLNAAFNKSQEFIDGKVVLELYKGNVFTRARESPSSLYDKELGSMHIEGGFDQKDSTGFIKINAIRLMAHRAIVEKQGRLRRK
ncbi:argininosuccinate synthase [Candidatus Micrarchaeota archaeon CG11_big_fil_rev_8_21_14_0_20_47_5]|nr:MAG: argininosuccinate synthase [Candidatus Micrarchaeota archaeon CG1_02_47_40]PIN84344.1 MAG: argininosuccinate synthase [Candidatus Micrarchaeota archaeon CG11_big_fil_rev_8_21_14_0_20_47_5]